LPAGAFEPQTHAMFCRDAARIYQACTGHVLSTEWIARLTEGSVHEDDLSLERVLNWHFYNNDGKIGKYWKYFFTVTVPMSAFSKGVLKRLIVLSLRKNPCRKFIRWPEELYIISRI